MKHAYTSRADIEFNNIEIDGRLYNIQAEAQGSWEDQGLGYLEAWGKPIYDSHFGISEFVIKDPYVFESVDDGDIRDIYDKNIIEKVIDHLHNHESETIIKILEEDRGEEDER